jgi:hypothetical protein
MTYSITRTYDSYENARSVVTELKGIGIEADDISVMAHDDRDDMGDLEVTTTDVDASPMANGAGIGGVVGGGAGLLTGLGLMAIPGVGPLVAAGWLATTAAGAAAGAVAGAATGGIVSALTDNGIDEDEAHTYAEAVRRGSILISVRTTEADEPRITAIMDRNSPSDLVARRSSWESEGWTGYDPASKPYSRDQRLAEQQRWM